jgi:cyclopropane-fatty-acyl-phospholipid synthase
MRSSGQSAARRLESLKTFLAHLRDRAGLDLGFVLWDGSTVPADLAADALAVAIADEGAVAALVRRPKLTTVANLWVTGRVDLRNGTIFDLVARRPKVRSKQIIKTIDRRLALSTAARFLLVPRGGPWPLEAIHGDKVRADGSEAANKANVNYHYDVSNAFYALFLDPEMVYTCGYFTDWNNDLATAQRDKLDMICRKLRLQPGDRLLDIGSGWGSLLCHAARHYGVHAHGVTLSEEQFAYTQAKVVRLGLGKLVTQELRDYTAVDGEFDKIASIGMFEQVGVANYDTYFRTVNRLLRPRGLYLHHAIARPAKKRDKDFHHYPPETRALVRYIFPGGAVDYIGMSLRNLERHGFEVHDVEGWREHYARTTRLWHDRLRANFDAAVNEVGSVKARLWLAYLAGVSIGFERAGGGIFQTLASKRARGASGLPPTRADLYR